MSVGDYKIRNQKEALIYLLVCSPYATKPGLRLQTEGVGFLLVGGFNYRTGKTGKSLISTGSVGESIFWRVE